MSEHKCNRCIHFKQHYALDNRSIFRVYCGHCTYPKVKRKRPDSQICEHFVLADPDEYAFATKEYLSKELLQYLFDLDLLPPIQDLNEGDR